MRLKTVAACALLSMIAASATAQTPPSAGDETQQTPGDPPGRIARLDYTAGTVTTERAGASDWSYAQINRPMTTGDQLWNDASARSELHIGSTAVRLGSSTAMSILALDDDTAQLRLSQGTLSMRAREVAPGTQYEIDTPNAALTVTTPGDVRIDVAPDGHATTVTVRSGGITAYGDGASVPVAAGQQITFAGTNLQQASANSAPAPDAFDQWAASRDASEDRSLSARYVSRDIPGYQDLDANGTWRNDPSYGAIWTPSNVSADWAPYRQGHWAWQAPWGWTWIDDAPWGFAPYHYGRWAYVGSQWAWVPGPMVASAPPTYSPALVAFVGDGDTGGADWSVPLIVGGIAAVGCAWFPLGPGEPWHPHHAGWSPRYYERVNQNVHIDRSIGIHNTYINYRAPRGLTALPSNAFVRGQPVGARPYAVDPSRWRNPHFFAGAPAIAPTRDSFAPGARRADYRPPQGGFARPVVATRAPVAPPAFGDAMAQRYRPNGTVQPRYDNVHVVASHGPARPVMSPRAPVVAGAPTHAQPMPPQANLQGGAARPAFSPHDNGVPRPAFAQNDNGAPRPAFAPHDNGVPRPPQNAQFGGEPHVYRGGMEGPQEHAPRPAPAQSVQTAPNTPTPRPSRGMNTPHDEPRVQAMQAPQPHAQMQMTAPAPMQPSQPPHFEHNAPPPQAMQPIQPMQPHVEAPRQPQPVAQQPRPEPQQFHQAPPHQQVQQMPHPQPQEARQPQQPQGDNNHHHG